MDDSVKTEVVNNICNSLIHYYVFLDKAKVMSDFLKQQHQSNIFSSITNPNQFANEIQKTLRSVNNDNHLRIEYNPRLEKDLIKFLSNKKGSAEVLADDLKKEEKKNFYFKKVEILPSNIGYIEFTNFAAPSPTARKTVHSAMQFISHTDGLIIDLRNNFGGNSEMSGEILSYFFPAKTYTGKTYNRIENKWSDSYIENKKEITTGLKLGMPIYILISNRTFSAAESFAYTLQSMKKAVIIGNASRGGAHATRSFSLGNGFVAFIPYSRGENVVTKTDWEGVGVIPDIRTEDHNGILSAQNYILDQKLLTEKDENEKRKINWQINFNKSKSSVAIINPKELIKFTGRFQEFEVTLSDNQLIFRDTNQKNSEPEKAIAITNHLFQIGNDYQVEFVTGSNDLCSAIKMYWDKGARKKTNNQWFETQDSISYWEDFSIQKIMYPNMTKFLPFYLDDKGFMQNDKSFMITGKHLSYLTAFLNSSLFKYCFIDNFPELQGGTRELRKIFLDKIPVLEIDNDLNSKFEIIVSKIQANIDSSTIKQILLQLDKMIFDLYELSEEERTAIGFIEIQ